MDAIPMSGQLAQTDTSMLGRVNTQLPMSVTAFEPIDIRKEQAKTMEREVRMGEDRAALTKQQEDIGDNAIIQEYLAKGGAGNLYSPDGIQAIIDNPSLRSKLSHATVSKYQDMIIAKKTAELRLEDLTNKKSEGDIARMTQRQSAQMEALKPAIDIYDENIAAGMKESEALAKFEVDKRNGLRSIKNIVAKEDSDNIASLSPQHLRHSMNESKYIQDRLLEKAKIKKEQALATEAEAKARMYGLGGKEAVALANIDEKVASGGMTEEQADKARKLYTKQKGAVEPTVSPETAKRIAQAYVETGDLSEMRQFGRGIQGAANINVIEQAVTEEMQKQGKSPAEIASRKMELSGATAGARALGTRSAKIDSAAFEVDQFADNALGAAKKVSRGNIVPINSILRKVKEGAGSAEEAAFATYVQGLIGAYATVIGRGTSTVHSQEEAAKVILKDYAPEQFAAMIDAIKKETRGVVKSSEVAGEHLRGATFKKGEGQVARPDVSGAVKNLTKEQQVIIGEREKQQLIIDTTESTAADKAQAKKEIAEIERNHPWLKKLGGEKKASPVKIASDADYSALPSGTEFIAPDGSHRRKP